MYEPCNVSCQREAHGESRFGTELTAAPAPRPAEGTRRWQYEDLREASRLTRSRSRELIAECHRALRRQTEAIAALRSLVPSPRPDRPLPAQAEPPNGHHRPSELEEEVVVGQLTLMPLRTAVMGTGRPVPLTPAEWQLMVTLVRHRTETLSRTEIASRAWGPAFADRHSQVEVYISRLRRKLARAGTCATILTVRGQGYRLSVEAEPAASPDG
jgi:DNA-binding response OmpR family regulator